MNFLDITYSKQDKLKLTVIIMISSIKQHFYEAHRIRITPVVSAEFSKLGPELEKACPNGAKDHSRGTSWGSIPVVVAYPVVGKLQACYWEVLVRTGFESRWGRISVAVPVVYLAMLNL